MYFQILKKFFKNFLLNSIFYILERYCVIFRCLSVYFYLLQKGRRIFFFTIFRFFSLDIKFFLVRFFFFGFFRFYIVGFLRFFFFVFLRRRLFKFYRLFYLRFSFIEFDVLESDKYDESLDDVFRCKFFYLKIFFIIIYLILELFIYMKCKVIRLVFCFQLI